VKPRSAGFTLIEIAIVLLIVGLLVTTVIQGQELIRAARVKALVSQQDAVQAAILGFQDRYRALPGDYREASIAIACRTPCPDGNGNGRIQTGGAPDESVLVWAHLAGAGFLNGDFTATSATTTPDPGNTPTNPYGAYLQVAFDSVWGYSSNPVSRHNIKTGNQVPVEVIAEVDRKADDGIPTAGRVQFSPYAADGTAPSWGGAPGACVNTDIPNPTAAWDLSSGQTNCGAATVL
jgi:prepilin-type N-terminal cleavage/methylation domain-containing protein